MPEQTINLNKMSGFPQCTKHRVLSLNECEANVVSYDEIKVGDTCTFAGISKGVSYSQVGTVSEIKEKRKARGAYKDIPDFYTLRLEGIVVYLN